MISDAHSILAILSTIICKSLQSACLTQHVPAGTKTFQRHKSSATLSNLLFNGVSESVARLSVRYGVPAEAHRAALHPMIQHPTSSTWHARVKDQIPFRVRLQMQGLSEAAMTPRGEADCGQRCNADCTSAMLGLL
eukprot:CAMPEP_0203936026 /NCGR_PEP_ID=MMETSP0359-20131031/73666_2 /ASSEMBLY_ACC=CAM_ASM_000338 /TAXON_ID=268821 /ORGANISM="Scrippsiella Hangoei, Strain SHTV-5" /LENGTH=135 /DNA_ID=CAMNT_0050865941 /DNA_START=89 /DNA_END=494 /DNA_ORIENTATION=-